MNQLGISNTGKLNYHLKMLDELITKNPDGTYLLTEKGTLATQLLDELSKETTRKMALNPFPMKNLIRTIVSSGLFLLVMLLLYFYGITPFIWVIYGLTLFAGSIISAIIVAKLPANIPKHPPEKRRTGTKIGFIILGGGIGMVTGFLGASLLLLATIRPLRLAGVSTVFLGFTLWVTVGSLIGITIGGLISYIVYRRSKYSKIDYYKEFV